MIALPTTPYAILLYGNKKKATPLVRGRGAAGEDVSLGGVRLLDFARTAAAIFDHGHHLIDDLGIPLGAAAIF